MLQYTIIKSSNLTAKEQAKMAIGAGCQWIELSTYGMTGEEVESNAADIIPLCQEAGVILLFHSHDAIVNKLRVHGIRLHEGDRSPLELREEFGGHVIIGVDYKPGLNWKELKRADVDYVVVSDATEELIAQVYSEAIATGIDIPIVAEGILTIGNFETLREAGASGFNIDIRSLIGPEYEVSLKQIITYCDILRG